MSTNFRSDKHSRTDYEMILRSVAKLITDEELDRGGLYGFADADEWDSFRNDDEIYENLNGLIKGIMNGIDILRQKIESLEK